MTERERWLLTALLVFLVAMSCLILAIPAAEAAMRAVGQ
jgi:hypothetical protein